MLGHLAHGPTPQGSLRPSSCQRCCRSGGASQPLLPTPYRLAWGRQASTVAAWQSQAKAGGTRTPCSPPSQREEAPGQRDHLWAEGQWLDTWPGRDGLGGQAEGGERAPHGLSVVSTGKRALGSDPHPSKCSTGRKVPEMGPAHPGRPLRAAPRPRATEPAPGNLQRELLMREPGSEGRAGWQGAHPSRGGWGGQGRRREQLLVGCEAPEDRPRGQGCGRSFVPRLPRGRFLRAAKGPPPNYSRKYFRDWVLGGLGVRLVLVCAHSLLALFREGSGGRERVQKGREGLRQKNKNNKNPS